MCTPLKNAHFELNEGVWPVLAVKVGLKRTQAPSDGSTLLKP